MPVYRERGPAERRLIRPLSCLSISAPSHGRPVPEAGFDFRIEAPGASHCPLQPDVISRITAAYEQALHTLGIKDCDDPLTEMIAKKIIKITQTGVHDPAEIAALAIKELEVR